MLPAKRYFRWFLSTVLMLGGLVGALGGGAVQAAPGKSPDHKNVVISEFRTRGPLGVSGEFIEVFNPTNNPIDISGWEIWVLDKSNSTITPNYTFPDTIAGTFPGGILLEEGQHFLIANIGWSTISGAVTPDDTFGFDIPDDGGIALTGPGMTPVVDQVGMTPGLSFVEGSPLLPLAGGSDQSYERGPGGNLGSCTDTNSNAADFKLLDLPDPQNSTSVTTACIGPAQTISFTSTAPASAVVGGAGYSPTAVATSGLPVFLMIDATASAICSISAGAVSFTAPGTCVIDADQPGDVIYYHKASQVQQSFAVGKGIQTISFSPPAPANAGVGGTYTPIAAATSHLTVALTIDDTASSICSISAGVVTFNVVGTCVIDAVQPGDVNWNAAPPVQQSIPIKNNQTITFNSPTPASATVGGATYSPIAIATSGLGVVFTIDPTATAVCSFSAGNVFFTAPGYCVIDADQPGDANYNAALRVQQSFPVFSAATATPTAPTHLVISEFRSRGPLGADDEFVEIYNPSAAGVSIGSWTIRSSGGCGTNIAILVTMPSNTLLKPGQHYLAAATGSSVTNADKTFTAGIDDNGGVGLFNYAGTVQDMAGMCAATTYREGNFLAPLLEENQNLNQSYERKPVGATSCYDTNDNFRDFELIQPADPQNSDSPIVLCTGVVPFTPTFTPTRSPTRTPTRAPTAIPGKIAINEFLPHPRTDWNGDGTIDTGDEYIEIINMGTESINVANWKLDNGAGSTNFYLLPNLTLLPRQIEVFYHADTGLRLSDMGSTVRLLKPDGRTADIFNYPLVNAADRTWCRLPDGSGAWAFICHPTPGKPNEPIKSGTSGTGMGEDTGSICVKNLAPQTILTAECNSPGGMMWGEAWNSEIWLKSRLKWGVFVE